MKPPGLPRSSLDMTGAMLLPILLLCLFFAVPSDVSAATSEQAVLQWKRLLLDAQALRLPTHFLKDIPGDFVQFEFEDLHAYAAEYHPEEHRLVLNRSLSFNGAGRALGSLTNMTSKELQVLYHELFHAYMDYLSDPERDRGRAPSSPLLELARKEQACRYAAVMIAPLPQKPDETEIRYLSDAEAWEALNETWAVFIGWAIWHQLEVQKKGTSAMFDKRLLAGQWMLRFEQAVLAGELRGYYVPRDPDERRLTEKRFLGKPSQISGEESLVLMTQALGFPKSFVDKLVSRPRLAGFFNRQEKCTGLAQP